MFVKRNRISSRRYLRPSLEASTLYVADVYTESFPEERLQQGYPYPLP